LSFLIEKDTIRASTASPRLVELLMALPKETLLENTTMTTPGRIKSSMEVLVARESGTRSMTEACNMLEAF
jgi:hypothetical protein